MPELHLDKLLQKVQALCDEDGHGIAALDVTALSARAGGGVLVVLQVPVTISPAGDELRTLGRRVQAIEGVKMVVTNLAP